MPRYVRLARFTEQGARNVRNLGKMLNEVREIMQSNGVQLVEAYATLGRYDLVAIIEAPNQETAAKVSALIAGNGNFMADTLAAVPIQDFVKAVSEG